MEPFEVWGSPDVTRDVIYAEDFANAIVTLLDSSEIRSGVFNIGTGVRTTVDDVVRWALRYSGHTPDSIQYTESGPSAINFRALNCDKIMRMTGWKPQIGVEAGIAATTQWWVKNKNWWTK